MNICLQATRMKLSKVNNIYTGWLKVFALLLPDRFFTPREVLRNHQPNWKSPILLLLSTSHLFLIQPRQANIFYIHHLHHFILIS